MMPSAPVWRSMSKEETMSDVHILAIDLAKRSFQVCGTDRGGACVDAPDFARVSSDFVCSMALLSVVCQASDRGLSHGAGMQFEEQGPHRFKELCARAPGLVLPILNIEVLAA
jgi:hypothetical protein